MSGTTLPRASFVKITEFDENLIQLINRNFSETEYLFDLISANIRSSTTIIVKEVTFSATGWQGTAAPYANEIEAIGIISGEKMLKDLLFTDNYTTDMALLNDWNNVYKIVGLENKLKAYAKAKPTVNLPVRLIIIR